MIRIRWEYENYGVNSYDHRPTLRFIPIRLLRLYLPEIFGSENRSFVGGDIYKAFFKNDDDTGIVSKLRRYRELPNSNYSRREIAKFSRDGGVYG